MQLRKVLWLNGSRAITLPVAYLRQLNAQPGDYIEIDLLDDKTLTIRRHQMPDERNRNYGQKITDSPDPED